MNAGWIGADWPAPDNIVAGTTLRDIDFASLGVPGEPAWLNQVHGANVVVAGNAGIRPDADGCIASEPGDICVVRTADCLPVLFCARDGTEIGIAHAGWRGLAAGVVEATVAKMAHAARDLLVWLGPAISQSAFEVGGEVRDAFIARDPGAEVCFVGNEQGRWQADLYELARRKLAEIGVSGIYGGGYCTFSDRERFFSYRRNADCGRMVSFVALEALENREDDAI